MLREAVLKPETIGAPAGDAAAGRGYTEISIIRLVLREGAASFRLAKLTHWAIPYPALIATSGAQTGVSLAHIRRAQNEADKWVLEGDVVSVQYLPEQAVVGLASLAAKPHVSAPENTRCSNESRSIA